MCVLQCRVTLLHMYYYYVPVVHCIFINEKVKSLVAYTGSRSMYRHGGVYICVPLGTCMYVDLHVLDLVVGYIQHVYGTLRRHIPVLVAHTH